MAASNIWALIVGGVAAGGALTGAIIWQQNHPDAPSIKDVAALVGSAPSQQRSSASSNAPAKTTTALQRPDGASLVKGPPPAPEPASGHGEPPHFDVVRVEPTGDAVVAGKGDPNAKVALLSAGKVVAETKADANGQFVIMPPTLHPGDHDLSLRQTSEGGRAGSESKQNVAVSVPKKANGDVIVALAEPGKPTKILSGPPGSKETPKTPGAAVRQPRPQVAVAHPSTKLTPPSPLKPNGPNLAIRSVELENGNGLFASGVAAAGTRLQIYLNGSHLADVVAGHDNQWTVTVRRGLNAGHYIVRADASADGRAVTARVEVPFDVPQAMTAQAGEPPAERGTPTEQPAPVGSSVPHDASQGKAPSSQQARSPASAGDAAPAHPSNAAGATEARRTPASPPTIVAAVPHPAAASPVEDAAPPRAPTPSPATAAANAVIEAVETATVLRGDNLWNISRARLGEGYRYTRIYAANSNQIRDPKLIYPGQIFVMPSSQRTN